MKKNLLSLFILLVVIFCFSGKISETKKGNSTKVIKFMNTVNEYPFDYGEKMFWDNPEEHAIIYDTSFDFLKKVKSFRKSDSKKFKNYNYCFIIPSPSKNDTLYSDFTLKSWIIKKDGIKTYYYDEKGEFANELRDIYSFFKDCW
jgi:hypothetical protein